MANVQPPELAIAVSRAGGLGSIAGATLSPGALRETIRSVRAALGLGAAGVQVGTAFLYTPECRVPREHLAALRTYESVVTDAYTGRAARMARTPVIDELLAGPRPLPFPEQRAVSAKVGPL